MAAKVLSFILCSFKVIQDRISIYHNIAKMSRLEPRSFSPEKGELKFRQKSAKKISMSSGYVHLCTLSKPLLLQAQLQSHNI